jgi:hypothetical protein
MRGIILCVSLTALGALGCNASDGGSKEKPGGGNVTIRMGSDGKTKVEGAGPLSGDPKTCAAFRACCSHAELGLACGLIQAAGGTCAQALKSARSMLRERGLTAPAGCR